MCKQWIMFLAGLTLIAGCGGGSGGGANSSYIGIQTQATVTTSNAKALSADAYTESQMASSVSGVAKDASDNSGKSSPLLESVSILENSVKTIFDLHKSSAKVVAANAQRTINGYSGSFSYNIDFDQSTGSFSGTLSFSLYKATSTSPSINGSIVISGAYNNSTDTFTSLNISMSNLSGAYGVKSFSMTGTVVYSTSVSTKNLSMSVLLTDNANGRTYWIKDLSLSLGGNSLSMSGTYYDPIHGYVVISTVTPLTVSSFDALPTSGQLLFSGSNGTKARMTFSGSGYTVEVDTAGNGTYVIVP